MCTSKRKLYNFCLFQNRPFTSAQAVCDTGVDYETVYRVFRSFILDGIIRSVGKDHRYIVYVATGKPLTDKGTSQKSYYHEYLGKLTSLVRSLSQSPSRSIAELSRKTGINRNMLSRCLNALQTQGVVERVPHAYANHAPGGWHYQISHMQTSCSQLGAAVRHTAESILPKSKKGASK